MAPLTGKDFRESWLELGLSQLGLNLQLVLHPQAAEQSLSAKRPTFKVGIQLYWCQSVQIRQQSLVLKGHQLCLLQVG